MALNLVSAGYVVSGLDITPKNELDSELASILTNYRQMDLIDTEALEENFAKYLDEFYPDILINNAGLKTFQKFSSLGFGTISAIAKVNYIAPILLTRVWLAKAPAKSRLTVVYLSSNAAYHGYEKGTMYCSSKSGLRVFAEALQREFSDNKLCTISLCPESFTSEDNSVRTRISMDDVYKQILKAIKQGKSQEVAIISTKYKLKYLMSDIKKYIKWFIG